MFEAFSEPDLDHRLAGDAEPSGFAVQGSDHPRREIDVDSSLFLAGSLCLPHIQRRGDVLAAIEPLVELLSRHGTDHASVRELS